MRISTLLLTLIVPTILSAQILPDRFVIFDPLDIHRDDTAGFSWLTGSHLVGEFVRYSNGSGLDHRWNARTGGYIEFARWDSSASIILVGTTEVVVDPQNDIAFNPRAILWEEGVLASFRMSSQSALQVGYVHRCKHDIDNTQPVEQRTLIYSGITTRALWRPRTIASGAVRLDAGLAIRNDFFLHLLDDRPYSAQARAAGRSIEQLVNSTGITGTLRLVPANSMFSVFAQANFMLSLVGASPGFSERFRGIDALGSFPFMETGLNITNPRGASMSLFARGELQRDAGIRAIPQSTTLMSFGIRVGTAMGMW